MTEEGADQPEQMQLSNGLSARVAYRVLCWAIVAFSKLYWRLGVEGLKNLPSGPFVLAPSHRSNIDSPILAAVPVRLHFMAKDSLFKYKATNLFFRTMGTFPVNRDSPDRDALNQCIELLKEGEPVVIFPEGTRQSGPVIQPLFDGAVYVAAKMQVPIVPVGIGGSEQVMRKGSKMIYPRKVHYIIGEPMMPPALKPSGRVSRVGVKDSTKLLYDELQRLFDEASQKAGVPNDHTQSPDVVDDGSHED